MCLPSQSTQFLQPRDRGFFKAFKSYYYTACNAFIRANPTLFINRLQFGELFGQACSKSATVQNAVSSFRATGIYPFRPDAIPDYGFLNDSYAPVFEVDNFEETGDNLRKILASPIPSTLKVETTRKRARQLAEILTSKENVLKRKSSLHKKHRH